MPVYVALLRGVNVGGARKLPMKELSPALAELGLEDVVTYIQSGNVVFRAPAGGRSSCRGSSSGSSRRSAST